MVALADQIIDALNGRMLRLDIANDVLVVERGRELPEAIQEALRRKGEARNFVLAYIAERANAHPCPFCFRDWCKLSCPLPVVEVTLD